ncbi:hypothetical protein GPA19_09855 [Azoarcus indigens]|uniref:Gluconate 2-dehydrogenase subunit 3-like protein n=1 Tax=Azoarcus indigens TaxID=29545 RepID=A0A4R6DTE0_9RHOO|nr:gluconate 2-dehydrogenase subunit 3 family protein [Azoarcus indigens]NMG65250.1 hypothetical protein [Azoarcus indigens]TDN47934.1 hypothetical protein C7389_11750 [Azoarcus indigens]
MPEPTSTSLHPHTLQALAQIQRMDRRAFLRFGLAAAGVAAGAGLLAPGAAQAALPEGIKVMSAGEHAVFQRLLAVMLPTDGSALVPAAQIPVMQTLDAALLATMEPHILQGLKGGVRYFDDGPQARYGKRFTALGDAEAARFCDEWADSPELPQRALAMGLKKLVGLAYWAHPPTWAPLGYDGPVTRKWGLQSLGNAPLPQVSQAQPQ